MKNEKKFLENETTSLCYYGTLDTLDGKKKNLEIKLKSIYWENQNALMIIISENRIIQNIFELNNQSAYKDQLLATVSHDLRTPLNGIVGMIALTMENLVDKTLRK